MEKGDIVNPNDSHFKETGENPVNNTRNSALILSQIEDSIDNNEIVSIASLYLQDERCSDIQKLLINPKTRQLVISQLKNISDRANRSLISSLIEGPEKIHAINGSQAKVDALSEEMIARQSHLFIEHTYKVPTDKDYLTDELRYRKSRKESGDARWTAWNYQDPQHRQDAQSILTEAASRTEEANSFLKEALEKAGLSEDSVVATSSRVKGIESLFNKISKFRKESWGKDSTIADAVDLLGTRVIVSELKPLEKIIQAIEELLSQKTELKVLRKENKFIVNHKGPDPYRAIHYIIALPERGGQRHSFELQLSTFPALIAGDLAHDAIYKPHLLNLPSELQQVVRDYHWESNERELKEYLNKSTEVEAELSSEQKIEKAIAEMDYNAFYDFLMSKIDLTKPLDEQTKDYLRRFHNKEIEKLEVLREADENTIIELAQAAHEGYYENNFQTFKNLSSDQLGCRLPEHAVSLLTPTAQAKYANRYESFDGIHNKLSVEDLELHKLTDKQLEQFFRAANKDLSRAGEWLRRLIEKIKSLRDDNDQTRKEREKIFVMDLNHNKFEKLLALTEEGKPDAIRNPNARQLFKKVLINSQLKAVATASLLTEVGGYDANGNYRDLSLEAIPKSDYSIREMLTHMFFISAIRPSSETAPLSFEKFAFSPATSWARNNDKSVDKSVLGKLVTNQLISIEKAIAKEENPILLARYEKARYELISKYLRVMVPDNDKLEGIVNNINNLCKEEVNALLKQGKQTSQLTRQIKDQDYFPSIINYFISEAGVPNIFDR